VRLVLADIDLEGAEAAAKGVRDAGGEAIGLRLDVTDEDAWVKASEAARAFGDVRILCSNAGVGGGAGKFEVYDTEVWRWNYAVNAHAHLYACRSFLGEMKASGEPSHVVITASMVGIVPAPVSIAYVSSKFATLGIAMGLRNELADTAVGLSVLCPGMSATNIVRTTRELRPGAQEVGAAAGTSQAMDAVLAGGMSPAAIGRRVVRAIEDGDFYIFTHPEWRRLVEPQIAEMLAAFGESADPHYRGDDIDSLVAANGAKGFNAAVAR
jgi:NAD(P)-dependent dehydrogenase (short-subunit alcohol dehydrogenase family)